MGVPAVPGVLARVFTGESVRGVFTEAAVWTEAHEDAVDVIGVNWESLPCDGPDTPPAYEMSVFYYEQGGERD